MCGSGRFSGGKKNYFDRFQLRSLSKKSFNWMFYPSISFIKTQKFTLRFTHSPKNRENLPIWHKNYLKSFNLNLHFHQNTEKVQQLCCQLLFRFINWISRPKTQKISNSLSSTDCWLNIRSLCKLLGNFRVGNGRLGKWLANDRVQRPL